MNTYYTYTATNKSNKVLYTGVTKSLINRLEQHKEQIHKNSFTAKYNINKLIYFEIYSDIRDAIAREKQIKAHSREYKLNLIINFNPGWKNLILETN